ncbi:MAG: hypothetical protein II312_07350 [Lachnospiraceae bacterium]|nr:hypothetical protein [Lachnospiraceae bacterium]
MNYNVDPDDTDCCTTGELVTLFRDKWNEANGTNIIWKNVYDGDHTKRRQRGSRVSIEHRNPLSSGNRPFDIIE